MYIIADENIPFVQTAFASLGEVKTLPGRTICQAHLHQSDVLLVRSITQVNAQLLQHTKVKFIATATSGINHVDTDYLQQSSIGFAHAQGSNALSVAQYVIAAICYWSLKFDKPLKQMSLGIIGYGHVGKALEKIATQLGITCVLNDPPLADCGQSGLCDLKTALACDVVSLHVPLHTHTKHPTQHLVNAKNMDCLKHDVLFINSARGGVVDETALMTFKHKHLDAQIILDVWEHEPNISIDMLKHTLIATAHIAGYSFDAKLRGTEMIYHACCQHFNQPPQWTTDDILTTLPTAMGLNLADSSNIRQAIVKAYDISQDSDKLKAILKNPATTTAEYFDQLRKNYAIRREWQNNIR